MIFGKVLICTTWLLASHFTLADPLFNPLVINHAQPPQTQTVKKEALKTHQAQGGFPFSIPDNDPVGIEIPIDMTGVFNSNITSLSISINIDHSYLRDLSATLVSPGGLAQLVLFSRVNSQVDLSGQYVFSDEAANDFWLDSFGPGVLAEDEYRTSTAGIYQNSNGYLNDHGGCTTRLRGAFKGLTPNQSNGIWSLIISDNQGGDTGQVNNVSLIFSEDTERIFRSPFEPITFAAYEPLLASDLLGNCKKAQYDFTGTGFSDYVISWEDNKNELNIQIISNEGAVTAADQYINTDLPFVDTEMTSGGDFDGDGIKDFVFARPYNDEKFQYLIRRSSRPDDLPIAIGAIIPPEEIKLDLQIGDYDGDRLDDFAFYISNDVTAELSGLNIIQSSNFLLRSIPTTDGITADFKPAGGFDNNGDQIADLLIFSKNQSGGSAFQSPRVYDGFTGDLVFNSGSDDGFGASTMVIPGSFLSQSLAGISALFTDSQNDFIFNIFDDQANSNALTFIDNAFLGNSVSDTPITGDYDGDGIDDFGYWNPSSAQFVIRPSGSVDPDNNLITVSPSGATSSDSPLANIRIR